MTSRGIIYSVCLCRVFTLGRREPWTQRLYLALGYSWTTAAVVLGSVARFASAVAADTRNALHGFVLLVASYPAHRLLRKTAAASHSI